MGTRGRTRAAPQQEQRQPLSAFLAWMRSSGISWDDSVMSIEEDVAKGCSGVALGVRAKRQVREGELLCSIPKSALLSPATTAVAPLLEEERIGHGLALTVAAMYEAAIGPASKWHPYMRSMPPREYLPIFWGDDELALLQGTELEGCADEDRADTAHDYDSAVAPLVARHPATFPAARCRLKDFRRAASWVASRAFYVDATHGDALVPLADAFNHKASVVALGKGYVVGEVADRGGGGPDGSSDTEGSDDGGSSSGEEDGSGDGSAGPGSGDGGGGGGRDDGRGGSDAATSSDSSGMAEGPGGGFAAVGGGRPVILSSAGEWERDGVNLRLEIGICSVDDGGGGAHGGGSAAANGAGSEPEAEREARGTARGRPAKRQRGPLPPPPPPVAGRLEIVAASAVPAGQEIHNTYGEHSNAELLRKYGFALPANPFDSVTLPPDALVGRAAAALGAAGGGEREARRRVRWLRGHSDLLDPGSEGDLSVLPHGRVTPELFALLRVLGAPAAEFDGWGSLADALAGPASADGGTRARTVGGVVLASLLEGNGSGSDSDSGSDSNAEQGRRARHSRPTRVVAERFQEVAIGGEAGALWTRAMAAALLAAIEEREARYPGGSSLTGDATELARWRGGDRSEHAAAVRGALQLRVTERTLLRQAGQAARRLLL